MLHQEEELPNDSGRPLNYDNFTDKKTKWLLLRSSVVCGGGCGGVGVCVGCGVCVCVSVFFFFFFFYFILFCFVALRFQYWTETSLTVIQSLQMTIHFALVYINISSRHSNLNFAHHFVIYWLLQMARKRINTRSHATEKPYMKKFVFFAKLVSQKSQ